MKYIALTLGPITRTIETAENTRGLWAASYLFSYLGKKIIEPFQNRDFLLPKITDDMFESGKFRGAGIFPDRYIFQSNESDFDNLKKHIDTVLNDLSKKMVEVINKPEKKEDCHYRIADKESVKTFLQKYLKVYFFEKDFSDEENVKEICEQTLALLEMQESFEPYINDKDAYLSRFFRKIPNSFLTADAGLSGGFPSIVEISSNEETEKPEHPYQRYIAYVKADGDSMGRALKKMKDAKLLSAALLEFNKKAPDTISQYNGFSIFTGGDDLLFLAPVFSKDKNASVFSLLQALDDVFHNSMKEKGKLIDSKDHPTLSFGVFISYYKYPMFEALSLADGLLSKAKAYNAPDEEKNNALKNNIVFSVQKHSGQTRETLLHKGHGDVIKSINKFVDKYLLVENQDKSTDEKKERKKILSSIMHGLREKEFLLRVAIRDNVMLGNFFTNNFNEVEHKHYKLFFEDLKNLLLIVYQAYLKDDSMERLKYSLPDFVKKDGCIDAELTAIETVYGILQFIHLVNQRNDKQDENI